MRDSRTLQSALLANTDTRSFDAWASGTEQRASDEVLERFTRRRTAAAVARALDLAVQRRADGPPKVGRRPVTKGD